MIRKCGAITLAVLALAAAAAAQELFPTRPITLVVPFPPGGVTDLTARPLAPALERALKQPVVVVNKAGAAGAVGAQLVAVAKPDGYTILLSVNSMTTIPQVDPLLGRTPTFTRDQFAPIARLSAEPAVLVVGADQPWKTVRELVEDAKKRPGEILFTSAGPYSPAHVGMEMFIHSAGIRLRHVPQVGAGPAVTALLGGHAAVSTLSLGTVASHVKGGKLRALAVYGLKRLPAMPEVPTAKEAGYDAEFYIWAGLFAPKGVPPHVLKVLREATRQAVQAPEFKAAMEKIETAVAYQDAEEFKAWWDRDAETLAALLKRIGKVEAK